MHDGAQIRSIRFDAGTWEAFSREARARGYSPAALVNAFCRAWTPDAGGTALDARQVAILLYAASLAGSQDPQTFLEFFNRAG